MNAWPTLKALSEFAGVVGLELLVLFVAGKLIALRLRGAQGQRCLWQIMLFAMLLVFVGELNGVRGWLRIPETKDPATAPLRTVVVTLKEQDPAVFITPSELVAAPRSVPPPIRQPGRNDSVWQQEAMCPAIILLGMSIALLLRVGAGQLLTLVFRAASRRWPDSELHESVVRIAGLLRIRRPVAIARGFKMTAPFTFGIWRPVVVLPNRFKETFTPQQQHVALAHELAHVAGFDSAWRSLGHLLCALLWWNPFAWLAKRELDRANELVADEASLLIADGPRQLAECLVLCAKSPRGPALVAWLGMDGGSLRSALGQRVARLLRLQSREIVHRRMPWYLRFVVSLLPVTLLWWGMAAAFPEKSSANGAAWHSSILGGAFAAAAAEVKAAPTPEADRIAVARLVQDGKVQYETGRLDEAQANFIEALRLERTNQAARYYLDLLTVQHTSSKRRRVYENLRHIHLPEWGPIDNLPLSEVIRRLHEAVRRQDPDGEGVQFSLSSHGAFSVAASGLPIETNNISGAQVRLGTVLRDMSVEQVLNILTTIVVPKIKYSVEDYGVIISPKDDEPAPLHTRFFKVDPNTLEKGLQSLVAFDFKTGQNDRLFKNPRPDEPGGGRRESTNSNGTIEFLSTATASETVIPAVRSFFRSVGVDLTVPGKAVFFNDRLGTLMVRATLPDLDTIEKAVQLFNMSPPQLVIHVKAMEVPVGAAENTLAQFGLTNASGSPAQKFTNSPSLKGILTEEQFQSIVREMQKAGGTDLLNAPAVTTLSGRQAQIKVVDIRYVVTRLDYGTNNPTGGTGVTVGPTNNGPLPVAEPFEIGPVIDVVPYVLADGYTIQMTVLPTLREFLGYDDPKTIWATGGPLALPDQQPTPLPKFRLRQAAATAMLYDGQTLVLGAGTASSTAMDKQPDWTNTTNYADVAPEKVAEYKTISARLDVLRRQELVLRAQYTDQHPIVKRTREQVADYEQRKKYLEADIPRLASIVAPPPVAPSTKALFFFITPRLIDPAGNPLHTDERLREIHKRVPEQRKTAP